MPQPPIITKSRQMTKSHLFYVTEFLRRSQVSFVGAWTPGSQSTNCLILDLLGAAPAALIPQMACSHLLPGCCCPGGLSWQKGTSEHFVHHQGSCKVSQLKETSFIKTAGWHGCPACSHFPLHTSVSKICNGNPQQELRSIWETLESLDPEIRWYFCM